jgi:hypothetical protein
MTKKNRIFRLPAKKEMLRLLRIANSNPCLLEVFYPLLLKEAGKEYTPEGLVNLLQRGIAENTKNDPVQARDIMEDQMIDFIKALSPDWKIVETARELFFWRERRIITKQYIAYESLEDVVAGSRLLITFKFDVCKKFKRERFQQLSQVLEINEEWLSAVCNQLTERGEWGNVHRAKEFNILRMDHTDRKRFARVLTPVIESIRVLPISK